MFSYNIFILLPSRTFVFELNFRNYTDFSHVEAGFYMLILKWKNLRHQEINDLPKVTELVSGIIRIRIRIYLF